MSTSPNPPDPPPTPAGWYPDPAQAGLRYWDGRQWTESRSGGQTPEVPAAQPPAPDLPAPPSQLHGSYDRALRDRLVAVGLFIVAGSALVGIISGVLLILVGIDEHFPAGASIGRAFGVVASLVQIAAYVVAALSIYGYSRARQTGLRQAVLVAAFAASFGVIGSLIITAVEAAHHFGGARVAGDFFGMLGSIITIGALVVAAAAFTGVRAQQDWRRRDRRLGQAALILLGSYFCGFITRVLAVISYSGSGTVGGYTAGLTIAVFAQIIAIGGVAGTAYAFLRQTESAGAAGDVLARVKSRDFLLGISAIVFSVSALIGAISAVVTANADANAFAPGKTVASAWIGGLSAFISAGTYACFALGFLIARSRASADRGALTTWSN